ncbi:MAG: hypothetical protein EAZ65_03815 [Verrucomicrobia bacterium]|nr:MAG: hypothetical protein EAZ84_02805 [Verrucomicrobiota bacterium]TAE88498.1 MAG: hypothetical protein EAZ82_04495 [Verrucomicrobiota bacterium]TAF26953.1 MAG: hypothetical protein EAZ71_03810 [Verrucomicrobiota bacterium]TAF42210.1 MAG: hypothetical protein EAZ65_03815 [Verrucomicrobiota bacterium]
MPLAPILLALLLVFVTDSRACCCDAAPTVVADSCCGAPGGDEPSFDHHCPCAQESPADFPQTDLLPIRTDTPPDLSAPSSLQSFARQTESARAARPRWIPSSPWHAPPSERRALLVRRTL